MALEDSSRLSPEELVERTEAALAAYGRERRRNAELVHRLQQMHAEQVDTLELKRRCAGGCRLHVTYMLETRVHRSASVWV